MGEVIEEESVLNGNFGIVVIYLFSRSKQENNPNIKQSVTRAA